MQGRDSPPNFSLVAGFSLRAAVPCHSAMSSDDRRSEAPQSGLLSSALSSLQGPFTAAAAGTPGGGAATPRGESFVLSVSSVLGAVMFCRGGWEGGVVWSSSSCLTRPAWEAPQLTRSWQGCGTKSSCQCQRWKARGDTPRSQGLGAMES
jgi:hypothetical protein